VRNTTGRSLERGGEFSGGGEEGVSWCRPPPALHATHGLKAQVAGPLTRRLKTTGRQRRRVEVKAAAIQPQRQRTGGLLRHTPWHTGTRAGDEGMK
jgi:hypothetical protein